MTRSGNEYGPPNGTVVTKRRESALKRSAPLMNRVDRASGRVFTVHHCLGGQRFAVRVSNPPLRPLRGLGSPALRLAPENPEHPTGPRHPPDPFRCHGTRHTESGFLNKLASFLQFVGTHDTGTWRSFLERCEGSDRCVGQHLRAAQLLLLRGVTPAAASQRCVFFMALAVRPSGQCHSEHPQRVRRLRNGAATLLPAARSSYLLGMPARYAALP